MHSISQIPRQRTGTRATPMAEGSYQYLYK